MRAQLDIFGMSWVLVLEGRPQEEEIAEHHEVLSSTGFQRNVEYEEEEE